MIEVVGLTARGWHGLPADLQQLILDAEIVLGAPRVLDLLHELPGQRRIPWPSPMRPQLPALLADLDGRRVVALASGDPLVAGVGATLIDLVGADQVRVHPGVSSVALARAAMRWPSETAQVIRLRGDDLDQLRRWLVDGARLIVLSRDADSAAEVAGLLAATGFGGSRLTVLGYLGSVEESRYSGLAEGWAGPPHPLSVVCVECVGDGLNSWAAGLPDSAYEHDGQLSKRDVRASALARLMPRPGQLLWDVGAGAGSVAIEWLRAHPRCRAIAVERDGERAARIGRNAAALGVPRLRVIAGSAPEALDGLPAPDAVFVGGGGTAATIEAAWAALRPRGRLVAHAVTVETEAVLVEAWQAYGGELTRIAVETLEPLGQFHGWKPARPVVQWSASKASS